MQKVSIKPQAMQIKQAVRLFDALNATGRQEFYKTLSDDEKDALYDTGNKQPDCQRPLDNEKPD